MDITLKTDTKEAERTLPAPVIPAPSPTKDRAIESDGILFSARFEDIARRIIMGQSTAEIAADLGVTDRHVRRLLHDPKMLEVYRRVHEEFYSDLDKVILDEKIQPIRRAHAQAIRAQTLIGEVIDEIRLRIQDRRARATDLKVGVDAAFGIIDRAKGPLSNAPGADRAAVHVEFNLDSTKTALLRDTIKESGIDLSDLGIIDVTPVEAQDDDDDGDEPTDTQPA